jgi:hypothetical protein
MRTIETKVWYINEHPNKKAVYEWMRDNMHYLNNYSLEEVTDSLNALQKIIGGELDYSFGVSPCRGEYISFTDYDVDKLNELEADLLPLTGVWCDYELVKGMQEDGDAYKVLVALHRDTEYVYSDDGLHEICTANDYEFNEKGELV